MDAIIAEHSRPAYEDESFAQDIQQELALTTPSLNLKFAMPPIANVGYLESRPPHNVADKYRSPHHGSAQ